MKKVFLSVKTSVPPCLGWLFVVVLIGAMTRVFATDTATTQSNLGQPGSQIQTGPVTIPRAVQFDFASRIKREPYRLMISTPAKMEPGKKYPVIYILDGYWYFAPAAGMVPAESSDHLQAAIVVGIGYPTDEMAVLLRRRTIDLTPPPLGEDFAAGPKVDGGVDHFIKFLFEEVRPFVESHYPVDRNRQSIFGMSNGGLAVLRILFRHPHSFQTYIAASPAIYHNNRAVLADEANFSQQVRSENLHLKLLITSAGEEQYRGTDPKLLAADVRFVDDASELAARLEKIDPVSFPVTRTIFPDENHKSVSLPALSRALKFALAPN